MNLLLAEDDAILADALTVQLRRSGFEVEHAPNGAVAEYLLLKNSYDIAILDLGLPRMNGRQLVEEALRLKPGLKVIIASGYSTSEDEGGARLPATVGYLTKPFDMQQLRRALEAV